MPRPMPPLHQHFAAKAQVAVGVVRAGEAVRGAHDEHGDRPWTIAKLEALYELAYLRVFAAWESCQEEVFCRTICGYISSAGQETLVQGPFPTLAAAEVAMLGGQAYKLWHNPTTLINRCQLFIASGPGAGPAAQQSVTAANLARLQRLAAIRHRIVHDQYDARVQFDGATMAYAVSALSGRSARNLLAGLE